LFFLGIFLGFIAKGIIAQSSVKLEQQIQNDIINLETLYLLEDQFPCNPEILEVTSQRLDYLGELITVLEVKQGKFDPQVLELKKLYTVLETRHFILTESRNSQCSENQNTALFFYSNAETCEAGVEKTAFVLTFLRNKYDNFNVYSFDIDLDSNIISALKSQYGIQGCSSVVLNKEKLSFPIENASQLESLII
ncbi:MAG: hypothetical protein KC506_03720, partial [Nanoarchaeota archaeon]|nr:hypothetical protein [Nanoarchaeota archaeon]